MENHLKSMKNNRNPAGWREFLRKKKPVLINLSWKLNKVAEDMKDVSCPRNAAAAATAAALHSSST